MSNDEPVDGPKIAAEILNRMDTPNKEKIVQAISKADPRLAQKIQASLWNFDEVTMVTSQGIQLLLNSIQHTDLVLSLKTASEDAKAVLFNNMSDRKAELVREDFAGLPAVKLSDVEAAQQRILKTLDGLRTSGQIRTQSKNDLWV